MGKDPARPSGWATWQRRVNVWLIGNEADFMRFKINIMPKIVGSAFIALSGLAFVSGVIGLALLA